MNLACWLLNGVWHHLMMMPYSNVSKFPHISQTLPHRHESNDTDTWLQVCNCAFILCFQACCSLAKQSSTFMARTKHTHEWGYECNFKLLQFCGETRMFSGVDGCVLHLIVPGCLSECSWAIPMHTSDYLITKSFNVYFHKVFYAGESENKGL